MDQESSGIELVYVCVCEGDVGRLGCGFDLLYSIFYILYSVGGIVSKISSLIFNKMFCESQSQSQDRGFRKSTQRHKSRLISASALAPLLVWSVPRDSSAYLSLHMPPTGRRLQWIAHAKVTDSARTCTATDPCSGQLQDSDTAGHVART